MELKFQNSDISLYSSQIVVDFYIFYFLPNTTSLKQFQSFQPIKFHNHFSFILLFMWSFRISYCRSLPVNIHVKFQFGFRFGLWCCLGWVLILFCGGGQVFESKGGRILFFSWAQVEYGYIYILFFWGGVRGARSAYWFHPCSKPNWANSSWPT